VRVVSSRRSHLIACAATALAAQAGAAMFRAPVEPGATVVIFGAGMVGLGAVVGARLQGAGRIIAVDTMPAKLEPLAL